MWEIISFLLCSFFPQIRAHGPDALPEPVKAHLGDIAKEKKENNSELGSKNEKTLSVQNRGYSRKKYCKNECRKHLTNCHDNSQQNFREKNLLNLWKNLSQTFYTTIFSELFKARKGTLKENMLIEASAF